MTRGRHLILMGMRGCGKTVVGRALAARLEVPFLDLDELALESFEEESVAEVWTHHGEPAWRDAEIAALTRGLQHPGAVIALGGGTPMIPDARKKLDQARGSGPVTIVYLRTGVDVLTTRIASEPGVRPSLTGGDPVAEVADVLASRENTYAELSDFDVQTDHASVDEIVAEIIARRPDGTVRR